MSRLNNTSTVGEVDLNSPSTASGTQVPNSQREHNSIASYVGKALNTAKDLLPTWASDVIGSPNQTIKARIESVQASLQTNNTETSDIRTLTGTATSATDMGTFTGTLLSDNLDIKSLLQEIETALEPITDALDLQGLWDASTNTPTIVSSTGTKGHFYIVSVAGSTTIDGISTWSVGDWILFDGAAWVRVDNNDAVSSVNTQTGAVVLNLDDINDVTETAIANLDLLQWNGSQWVNSKNVDVSGTASATQRIVTASDTTANLTSLARKAGAIYFSTDELIYKGDDGTNLVDIGGGGTGEGGINYILNPGAEKDTTGWLLYDDGAVADPVDGTAGSATVLTFNRNTTVSDVIRGEGSFSIGHGAADGQGEGVSYDFEIDRVDRGKRLFVSLEYYVNTTNYISGDIAVYVYDITNANLIGRVSNDDNGDLLSVLQPGGKFTGSFETASNSINYRLIFHQTSTTASAYTMFIDQIKVGPDTLVPGSITTPWTTYVPTTQGFGTITNDNFQYMRVGSSLFIKGTFTTGTVTATEARIHFPPGLTSKSLGDAGPGIRDIAGLLYRNVTSSEYIMNDIIGDGLNYARFADRATTKNPIVARNGNALFGNTENATYVTGPIEINEWSAGAQLSTTETIFSTAKAKYNSNIITLIDNNNADVVDYEDVVFDPFSSVTTGSSWNYLAPRSGYYQVNAGVEFTATLSWTAGEVGVLFIYVNGTSVSQLDRFEIDPTVSQSAVFQLSGSDLVYLNKGDTLDIRAFQNSGAALNLSGNADANFVSIAELPDFSTFSVYGQQETFEIEPTVNTTTSLANTYLAVTGSSLVLGPGKYLVGYTTLFFINNSSGGTAGVSGNIRLTQDGALVPGSITAARYSAIAAGAALYLPVYKETELILTSTKTIQAEIRCDQAAASGVVRWYGTGNFDGALTDPDADSKVWARRIS